MPILRTGEEVSNWRGKKFLTSSDEQELIRLIQEEQREGAPGYAQRIKVLQKAKSRRFLGSDWAAEEFQAYTETAEAHGRTSPASTAAYNEFIAAQGDLQHALLAAPPKPIEKEREGMLDKVLIPLLAGERTSGTTIYALRKRLFGKIDWIEQREAGEWFKEISPSQALGISTPETKITTPRGVLALGLDIGLDPYTWIGLGPIKYGGLGLVKIGGRQAEKVLGPKGIKYLQKTIDTGLSREAADKKLLDLIESGHTEYLAARKYVEPSVHLFRQKLFYTRPYQELARKAWDVLPYAQKRARGVDILQTAFIPFHKIIKDVEDAAKKPFLQFRRGSASETATRGKAIEQLYTTTPRSANEEVVLALEAAITPTSPEARNAALKLRKMYDEAFEEQVALGMIQPGQYRKEYMHHALTKEGREWLKKELGTEYEHGLSIAEYRRKLGSAEERMFEGGVYDVNKLMREQHAIKEFFIEDPYLAAQQFAVQHVRATHSHILHKQIVGEYGRPIADVEKRRGVQPKVTKIEGIEHTLFEYKGTETYLPTVLVDELKRTRQASGFWSETYDPALGTLKKAWISIWPGFYSRNIYGGVGWQNILAGVEPSDYARNIDIMYGDPGKMYDVPLYGRKSGEELKELMQAHNVYGQTGFIGEPSSYTSGLGTLGRAYKKYPERMMHLTEDQLRGPIFLHYLYKTGDPEYAAEMVYKYHFEYLRGTYTAFEEDVLFRMVPFGKWTRGNIPLQTEMAFRQPGKYAALAKAREMGTTPEEYNLQTKWQKDKITYVHDGTVVSLDLPIFELPGLWGREEAFFGITPFLKFGMRALEGKGTWGQKVESITTWKGVKQHADLAAMTFAGRYVYAARELEATYKGERPLAYTLAHQLAGVGVYELTESFEQIEEAYKVAKYTKPSPTERERAIAWAAQGKIAGAKVFALPLSEGEDDAMWRAVGTMPVEINDKMVNRVVEKLKDTGVHNLYRLRGFGTLISLTPEERELTQGFKPTNEQLKLLEEISALGVTAAGATARDLYLEMFWERHELYESRLARRKPFTEAERMEAVARRPAHLQELSLKEIRYESGKKAGILALTSEELEAATGFKLSEAQKEWMFRDTRKITPVEQYKAWAQEHRDELLQEEALEEERREELHSLRGIIRSKDEYSQIQTGSTGERFKRRRELEEMLGIGVDR